MPPYLFVLYTHISPILIVCDVDVGRFLCLGSSASLCSSSSLSPTQRSSTTIGSNPGRITVCLVWCSTKQLLHFFVLHGKRGTVCCFHYEFIRVPIRTLQDLLSIVQQRNVLKLLVREIPWRTAPSICMRGLAIKNNPLQHEFENHLVGNVLPGHECRCSKTKIHFVDSVGAEYMVGHFKSHSMLNVTAQYIHVDDRKQSSRAWCWPPEHETKKISCTVLDSVHEGLCTKITFCAQYWCKVLSRQPKSPLVPSVVDMYMGVGDHESSRVQCWTLSATVACSSTKHLVLSIGAKHTFGNWKPLLCPEFNMAKHIRLGDEKHPNVLSASLENTSVRHHFVVSVGPCTLGQKASPRAQCWSQVHSGQPKKPSHAQCNDIVLIHAVWRSRTSLSYSVLTSRVRELKTPSRL